MTMIAGTKYNKENTPEKVSILFNNDLDRCWDQKVWAPIMAAFSNKMVIFMTGS